jgi:hypothetical protein
VSAITYKVNRKSGDYIKGVVIASNRSKRAHLGWAEGLIVGFLLLCACGAVCLLLLI